MRGKSLKFLRTTLIIAIAFIVPLAIFSADTTQKETPTAKGSVAEGQKVFKKNCNMCHFPDKTDKKLGPGLKGLFKLKELPDSHKPAEEAIIREQIEKGSKAMPGFGKKLSKADLDNLMAYLKTL